MIERERERRSAHKSEFEIVKEFTKILGLENQTDGTLFIYKSKEKGMALKPDGYYYACGVTFILDAKSYNQFFKGQLEDYMILEQNENFVGFKYNGKNFECYINGKINKNEIEPKNFNYYLENYFKDISPKTNQEIVNQSSKKLANSFRNSKINKQMNVPFIGAIMLCIKFSNKLENFIGSTTINTLQLIKENIDVIIQDSPLTKKQKKEFLKQILGDSTLVKAKYIDLINIISDISKIYNFINVSEYKGHDTMNNFLKIFRKWNSADSQEKGEVFTPDHIAKFMFKLINCSKDDVILDPTCGSGTFLTNALALMLDEATTSEEKNNIKENQLIGIEYDDFNATLAGINMMLHGDGASNIFCEDCFVKLPRLKNCFNKVLMNPPFSQSDEELKFVLHTLNSCKEKGLVAAILPKSIAKNNMQLNWKKEIFNNHKLLKIITLPVNLFHPTNVPTCIFIFQAWQKPDVNLAIEQYDFSDDGFYIAKHIGRIEKDFEEKMKNFWMQKPLINKINYDSNWLAFEEDNNVSKLDFIKSKLDFMLIDKDLKEEIIKGNGKLNYDVSVSNKEIEFNNWKYFKLGEIFSINKTLDSSKIKIAGSIPYVSRKGQNNGVGEYRNVPKELLEKDAITVHSEWNANLIAYYHDGPFCADGKILKLKNKNLNTSIGLFVCAVLRKIKVIDYRKDTINELEIFLPAKDDEPDWEYMEKYINNQL